MFLPRSRDETLVILVSDDARNSYGSMDGHGAVPFMEILSSERSAEKHELLENWPHFA
jgi:hypothetical protein